MAPGLDELEWREFQDFTGGLWERGNDRLCAPNGLLECVDCFPMPDGGLRAFAKFAPIGAAFSSSAAAVTPIAPANAHVLGVWYTTVPVQAAPGGGLVCLTLQLSPNAALPGVVRWRVQIWKLSSTGDAVGGANVYTEAMLNGDGDASWVAAVSRDVAEFDSAVNAVSFRSVAAGAQTYVTFCGNTTVAGESMGGIYRLGLGGSTASIIIPATRFNGNWYLHSLETHQNRLIFTGEFDGVGDAAIYYTNAGTDTAVTTANALAPTDQAGQISLLSPLPPSDLVFLQQAHAFGTIQGSLTAPTIRHQAFQHLRVRNRPVRTDAGLALVVHNEGLYFWDGNTLQPASNAIQGDPMGGTPYNNSTFSEGSVDPTYAKPYSRTAIVSDLEGAPPFSGTFALDLSGQLGVYENWLFCNNGYMMDLRTGAWFKQSSAPGARYWASDTLERRMFVATRTRFSAALDARGGGTPAPLYWSRMGESSWDAMDTYSFTLPLIESPGQRTNLRELEYDLSTHNGSSTISVEVTPASGDVIKLGPFDLADSRADTVRILVPGHPQNWYKIRTILSSNRADEAPTLMRMRVATQPSTRTPVNRA